MADQFWARIEDGVVKETTTVNPEGRYHPDLVWVLADETVNQMDTYDWETGTFTGFIPPEEPDHVIDENGAKVPGEFLEDPVGPIPD